MATEFPIRMISAGGTRSGLGNLGDNLTSSGVGSLSPSSSDEDVTQELDLLLRGHRLHESIFSRRETGSYRSESAPPTVPGSLTSMENFFADNNANAENGSQCNTPRFGDGLDVFESEYELRSDPEYLAYYYSHIHLNPRLPPPLISRSNYHLAHCLGGTGERKKLRSFDENNKNLHFFSRAVLPTHKEEADFSEEEKSSMTCLMKQLSNEWQERGVGAFPGISSSTLAARQKSLVDLIQEDFPRTPSPVFNQLRSSSRATIEDGLDSSNSNIEMNQLHDIGPIAVNSRSATPNLCSAQNLAESANVGFSSGFAPSILRKPSPAPLAALPPSSGNAIVDEIAGLNKNSALSISEARNVSPACDTNAMKTADLATVFQSLSVSDAQKKNDQMHLVHQAREQLQNNLIGQQDLNQHLQKHPPQVEESDMQVSSSQVFTEALQQQPFLGSDKGFRTAAKYGIPNVVAHSESLGFQPGGAPNMYAAAAAAAAMSYVTGNPYYQNMQSVPLYASQYGLSGYTMNPALLPAMLAGLTFPGAMPVTYDGTAAAAVAASMRARVNASGSLGGLGMDTQNLYKYAGQGGTFPSHFEDPFYLQYLQQCSVEDAFAAAALNDPSIRAYMPPGHVDPFQLQKSQIASICGYPTDQRPQFSRSTSPKMPVGSKSGSISPTYYGIPPSIGLVMPFVNSPILSPVLPGSPILPRRQAEQAVAFSSGTVLNSAGAAATGWQSQGGIDGFDDVKDSPLLEELKNSQTRTLELSDIAGHVVEFSVDQHGSRFIQQKLEMAAIEDKNLIFQEVRPQALRLMTDVFGNYVIQKFFEHGSLVQRTELANQLRGHVLNLSLQMYGCRVIQKALEVINVADQIQLVSELDGHVMRCVHDQNGNHVIQKCIECVPPDRINFIVSAFYGQVVTLSTHPYGCRVIQRVLEHCTEEQKQHGIVDVILSATCSLAQDHYGNYVVQHVLEHGNQEVKGEIINKLAGKMVQMSQHKFASNVIEKCLEFGSPTERQTLIDEMLGDSDENEPLQAMMKDQYANYVVQKIIEICNDTQRELLLSRIKVHLNALKKYTYGKHIVARIEKLVAAGERCGVQLSS